MLCTDASPVHPVLKDLLLAANVITPMVCTDASPVQPVLKTWLLRGLHRLWNTVRPMHRCIAGSSGAEKYSPGRLTSSLEHSMPNAPMPVVMSSVQPVPLRLA